MDPANLLTKWHWIVELARKKPGTVLFSLNHVIDFEWMREAYIRTRKDGATGIDGVTAQDYEANLEANLRDLLERIKSGRYQAPPVRRTYIPKADGSRKAQSFDFLGFTHSWGKSRKGKNVVRQMTAKRRFARSLAAVKDWCRINRHRPAREQRAWLSAVLVGHYAYYGHHGNIRRIQEYRYQVERIWRQWMERCTRGKPFTWASFNAFLVRRTLPAARIIHRYT